MGSAEPLGEGVAGRSGAGAYARVGRRSRRWDGAFELLERRRQAFAAQRAVRPRLIAAREAVSLLRDELVSLARANADPACALQQPRFAYAARLRAELQVAEQQLRDLRAEREQVLRELRSLRQA